VLFQKIVFSLKINVLVLFLLKSLLTFLKILFHHITILFKSFKQSFNLKFVLILDLKYFFLNL